MEVHGLAWLYATAIVFGYAYGAVASFFPAIVGDFFGRERAGALVGFLFALGGSISAWGPAAAGAIYDHTGTYALAFFGSAALSALALGAVVLARPPGPPPRRAAA